MSALRYRGRHHHPGPLRRLLHALTPRPRPHAAAMRAAPAPQPPAAPPASGPLPARGDRGAFTAEFAAALPALVMLLTLGLTAVSAAADRGRCYDAARDAALAAARGEPGGDAGAVSAPPGATITLRAEGDQVRAVVTAPVRTLGLNLPELRFTGEAVAAIEPGVTVVAE